MPVSHFRTRSFEHLGVGSNPLVGDPLAAHHHWAASMARPPIITSIFVHVPPDHDGTFDWTNVSSYGREDCVAT